MNKRTDIRYINVTIDMETDAAFGQPVSTRKVRVPIDTPPDDLASAVKITLGYQLAEARFLGLIVKPEEEAV